MSPIIFLEPTIKYCPYCKADLEELDSTTFYCPNCISQFQIEVDVISDKLAKEVLGE